MTNTSLSKMFNVTDLIILKYIWIQLLGRFTLYCASLVNREYVVACTMQSTRTARLVLLAVTVSWGKKKGSRGEILMGVAS